MGVNAIVISEIENGFLVQFQDHENYTETKTVFVKTLQEALENIANELLD